MRTMTLSIVLLTLSMGAVAEEYECGGWFCGSPTFSEVDDTAQIRTSDPYILPPYYASCDLTNCCGDGKCYFNAGIKTLSAGGFSATYEAGLTLELPTGVGVNSSGQVTVNGETSTQIEITAGVASDLGFCEQCDGKIGPQYMTITKDYLADVECTWLGDTCDSAINVPIQEKLWYRISDMHSAIEVTGYNGCPACEDPAHPTCSGC